MSYNPCPKYEFNRKSYESRFKAEALEILVKQEKATGESTTDEDLEVLTDKLVQKERVGYEKVLLEERLLSLPRRYRGYVFDDFVRRDERDQAVVEHMASGKSAILYGPNGTGKTMLAICAVRRQWEAGRYAQYILAADFFDIVRSSFSGGDPLKVLKEFGAYDYLVIDEVDKKHGSATEFVYLYRLINDRYNDMRATVLISNASRKELGKVIGASAFSRIAGEGKIIQMDGEDYRKRKMYE